MVLKILLATVRITNKLKAQSILVKLHKYHFLNLCPYFPLFVLRNNLKKHKTLISISHKKTTMLYCDEIYEIKNSKLTKKDVQQ